MISRLISNAASQAQTARHLSTSSPEVDALEKRVDSLELACAGLWELLKTKIGCTDDELIQAVRAVDARDGQMDGKISMNAVPDCPSCGRKMLTRHTTSCTWCGAKIMRMPFTGG